MVKHCPYLTQFLTCLDHVTDRQASTNQRRWFKQAAGRWAFALKDHSRLVVASNPNFGRFITLGITLQVTSLRFATRHTQWDYWGSHGQLQDLIPEQAGFEHSIAPAPEHDFFLLNHHAHTPDLVPVTRQTI